MTSATAATQPPGAPEPLRAALVGALGVVYGDIGTSPLYAFRACFQGFGLEPTEANVLGILSLVFWALILVVSVKYLLLVLRADHKGEGGVLALMTLATQGSRRRLALMFGLLGAGLIYGDSMLTPAVSVLSALEGLQVAAPKTAKAIVPLALLILILLFAVQRYGTAKIGRAFGPVMIVWFLCIAALGTHWIIQNPRVMLAVDPMRGFDFLRVGGLSAFRVLGGVFLVVTGAEALYADMGHFGRRPIRLGWFACVLPSLVLSYFGQGALVLQRSADASHPFFEMAPSWGLYPLIALATLATVIASQGVISGAFSLTYQAQQLGFLPHFTNNHYAARRMGQVYIPFVNGALFVSTLFLVVSFRSSQQLAGAYGVAVSGTMVLTSLLVFVYVRAVLGWRGFRAALVVGMFLVVDLCFLGSNLTRFVQGGWIPILVGVIVFVIMTTWQHGRELLTQRRRADLLDIAALSRRVEDSPPYRAPGTAVFFSKDATGIPASLIDNLERNHVLHQRVILLTLVIEEVPRVPSADRLEIESLPLGITRVIGHYGFMQTPNIPVLLDEAKQHDDLLELNDATYFIARETLVVTNAKGMQVWRKRIFQFLSLSQSDPTQRFQLPTKRVVELGDQIKL